MKFKRLKIDSEPAQEFILTDSFKQVMDEIKEGRYSIPEGEETVGLVSGEKKPLISQLLSLEIDAFTEMYSVCIHGQRHTLCFEN